MKRYTTTLRMTPVWNTEQVKKHITTLEESNVCSQTQIKNNLSGK